MKRIDLRGLSCPQPVIEVKKEIDAGASEIQAIVDCGASEENIKRLANANGYEMSQESSDEGIIITLKR